MPDGEFTRSEVVAARLARKVGPLFGVRWAHNPFGRTWVCDFASVTLGEIARGAPAPSKEEQARAHESRKRGDGQNDWGIEGRTVWSGRQALPTTLANATLNRFGPNTKAAVVLAGANRLLEDATEAISSVCDYLADQKTPDSLALAIWAGLTLEAFRGQPALVVAAIQARAVQQSLTARWGSQVALGDLGPTSARCEIGADPHGAADETLQPIRFALIDGTLDVLLGVDGGAGVERRQDIAGAWCRRLLNMGSPGSGQVWLTERDGHRVANSYQRVNAMVAPFVSEVVTDTHSAGDTLVPSWPPAEFVEQLPTLSLRSHAAAAHIAVSYQRYVDRAAAEGPDARPAIRAYLDEAVAAVGRLGAEDPASLLLGGFQEYLRLLDSVRTPSGDGAAVREHAEVLMAGQRRTVSALQMLKIDPGAASYLLEIGNVALESARDRLTNLPAVDRSMARMWREALTARGLPPDPAAHLEELNDSQIFHLAYYAEYLASHDSSADLRRALRILIAVADVRDRVAAKEPAGITAKHVAGRDAHLTCAEVAAKLAVQIPERERGARAAAWSTVALHVCAVLENPSADALLDEGNESRERRVFGQLGPGLRHLLEHEPNMLGIKKIERVQRLVDIALDRWSAQKLRPDDRAAIDALKELRSDLIDRAKEIERPE